MSRRYKDIGGFRQMRKAVRWIVVINGEEFPFSRKKHAILSGKTALSQGCRTELIEETELRFRSGCSARPKENLRYRINISNQLSEN